jgi:hypothetical protein
MKPLSLRVAAAAEFLTGLALIAVPSLVSRLLLGEGLSGVALPVARVAGIALIALGVACGPGFRALGGMLTYSGLATLYLAYLGVSGGSPGVLLWPAVGLHAILTVVLARSWFDARKAPNSGRASQGLQG